MLENETQSWSKCNICGGRFSGKDELKSHVRSAHFGMDDKVQTCEPDRLPEVICLEDDTETYKSDDSITLDLESVCHACFSIFKNQEDLNLHIRMAHGHSDNDIIEIQKVDIPNDEKKIKALDPVPVLSKSPVSISKEAIEFQQAETNVTTEKTSDIGDINECLITNEIIPRSNLLMCNICLKEFDNKDSLTIHIKAVHFGLSSYKCAMCTKSFETKECVIKHYTECDGHCATSLPEPKNILKRKESPDQSKSRRSKRVKKAIQVKKEEVESNSVRVSKRLKEQRLKKEAKSRLRKLPDRKEPARSKKVKKAIQVKKENVKPKNVNVSKRLKEQRLKKDFEAKSHCELAMNKRELSKPLRGKNVRRKIKAAAKTKLVENKTMENVKKNIRPCYICGEIFNDELSHMSLNHRFDGKAVLQIGPKNTVGKFKCLRCGKVCELLESMQCHLQLKCLRAPFDGVNELQDLYCTICGEHFSDYKLHDKHVAYTHYSHLFENETLYKPSIPFRHILLYHVSPSVCQHCGESCQYVIENKMKRSNTEIKCIEGPFVCPFPHQSKLSRCTLDVLLHHLKLCPYKGGVLALQCNNCFKMLLCNNSSEQILLLKQIINKDDLECCSKNDKRFKCYCCANDYPWSTITHELVKSIKRLDDVRRVSFDGEDKFNRVLSSNPRIHNCRGRYLKPLSSVTFSSQTDVPKKRRTKSIENRGFQNSIKISNTFSQAQAPKIAVNSRPLLGRTTDQFRNGSLKRLEVSNPHDKAIKSMNYVANDVTVVGSISPTEPTGENHKGPSKKDTCNANKMQSLNEDSSICQVSKVEYSTENKENLNVALEPTIQSKSACNDSDIPPFAKASNNSGTVESANLNKFKTKNVIQKPAIQLNSSCEHSGITGSEKAPKSTEEAKSVPLESVETPKVTSGKFLDRQFMCQEQTATIDHDSELLGFPSLSYASKYQRGKDINRRFKCFDCDSNFACKLSWKDHIKRLHPDCVILSCDIPGCCYECQRPFDLQSHILSQHSCNSTYGCAVCLKMFESEGELVNHTLSIHPVI